MNQRLAKEFRPLLVPLVIALGAAGLMAIKGGFAQAYGNDAEIEANFNILFLIALRAAPTIFFLSLTLLAAGSYGFEFQQRTLALLLSQPLARARIWREKTLLVAGCTGTAGVAYLLGVAGLHSFLSVPLVLGRDEHLMAVTFLLATACGAGFWTLLARSTLGGMALNAGSQCVVLLGVTDLLARIYGPDLDFYDSRNLNALVAAGLCYAAIFLWLGWRKFARLQLRFPMGGAGFSSVESFAALKWDFGWLRCRPTSGLSNLIRKEVRLNKPVFLVAIVFSICWLLALALLLALPRHKETLIIILNGFTALYVPFLFVLAGCAALGEERGLGLNAWQLTLPVSVRRQWLIKLAVSLILGVALGMLLPCLLSWVTAPKAKIGLRLLFEGNDDGRAALLVGCSLLFLISFWAASHLTNTVAAAVATLIAFPVLGGCAVLAFAWTPSIGGLCVMVFEWSAAHFQLPPNGNWTQLVLLPIACFGLWLLLSQSLAQFRRPQAQRLVLLRHSITLAAVGFCYFLGLAVINESVRQLESGLTGEIQQALLTLPSASVASTHEHPRIVTVQDLSDTGKLSPITKAWLRNTAISFEPVYQSRGRQNQGYHVNIVFPDGKRYSFLLDGPVRGVRAP